MVGLVPECPFQAELDQLEEEQLEDGGWMFDWLDWSQGQRVEWRGAVTLRALATLAAHGRAGG
ncbi:hypothetical protein AAH979_06270 [Plantactinospora sp. ZYX-F-223]